MSRPEETRTETRRPWPMTWVVVAIAVYIVGYTVVNFGFRKDDPAHEPWAEAQERRQATAQRGALDWSRFRVTLRPAAGGAAPAPPAEVRREPAPARLDRALPIELVLIMPGKPELAAAPAAVAAPSTVEAAGPMRLRLGFAARDRPEALGEMLTYARERHVRFFLQDSSRTAPDAAPVPAADELAVEVPAGVLEPGAWRASLHCRDAVFTWDFTVR